MPQNCCSAFESYIWREKKDARRQFSIYWVTCKIWPLMVQVRLAQPVAIWLLDQEEMERERTRRERGNEGRMRKSQTQFTAFVGSVAEILTFPFWIETKPHNWCQPGAGGELHKFICWTAWGIFIANIVKIPKCWHSYYDDVEIKKTNKQEFHSFQVN